MLIGQWVDWHTTLINEVSYASIETYNGDADEWMGQTPPWW